MRSMNRQNGRAWATSLLVILSLNVASCATTERRIERSPNKADLVHKQLWNYPTIKHALNEYLAADKPNGRWLVAIAVGLEDARLDGISTVRGDVTELLGPPDSTYRHPKRKEVGIYSYVDQGQDRSFRVVFNSDGEVDRILF